MKLKLFEMGELVEGSSVGESYIGLWWYEMMCDTPPDLRLETVLLTFSWPRLGTHYDMNAREVRYGWWIHWIYLYREDRWPLPHVGLHASKYFYKEK